MAPAIPNPMMIRSGEATAFIIACIFMRMLLFSVLSRLMNAELTELRTACPSRDNNVIRMRLPVPGLFRMYVAISSETMKRESEIMRVKRSLKKIPVLIKLAAFLSFPSIWKCDENFIIAGEIPRSVKATNKDGTTSMIVKRP